MSLKNQFLIIFLSIFILLVGSLLTFYNILKNEKNVALAELQRYESYLLADELRQSSDDLTRMARTYTVTANPKFRQHFDRILKIRDGKIPRPANYSGIYWDFVTATGSYPSSPSDRQVSLESLMKSKDFTRDEMNLLKEAKKRSDALVHLENRAMNAMAGLYPDKEGHFSIKKEPDKTLAREIMHSPEYHKIKKEIMTPMQEFFHKVDNRTAQDVLFLKKKGERFNLLMLFLMGSAILLLFISSALIFFQSKHSKQSESRFQTWKTSDGWKRKIFFIYRSWPIFILAAVAFIINLSFFWWAKKIVEQQTRANLTAELQTIRDIAYSGSIQWLHEAELTLESFISFSSIKENYKNRHLLGKEKSQKLFKKDLTAFIKINKYVNYFLIDRSGVVISSSQNHLVGKNVSSDLPDKLISQLKGPKATALIFPENLTENKDNLFNKNIILGGYVRSHSDENPGFLVIEAPLSGNFSRVIQTGRLKKTGESYVFNGDGYLLSESRFNDQLYEIGLLKKGQNSSLAIRITDPGVNLILYPENRPQKSGSRFTEMVLNAFQGTKGVDLTPYNDYRGVPVIGAWVWNSEYNIGFATEIDSKEAFFTLRLFKKQTNSQLFISLLLILTMTIIFIWNRALVSEVNEKLKEAYKFIKIHKDRMEEELQVGRQIQMSMVPETFPQHSQFSIYAKLKPVLELGGDFYDFFLLDKNRLCFFIGDVSGKGVPSALFMAVTKTLLRSAAFEYPSTDKILFEVNKNINLNNPYCMFATVFISIIDFSTGECSYTNAGHHSSYVKKQNSTLLVLDQTHGPVAGAVENVNFSKDSIFLQKGDILIAYTDGITEAMDEQNTLYGAERLEDLLKKEKFNSAKDLADSVIENVSVFSGTSNQSDDIALIAVKYKG